MAEAIARLDLDFSREPKTGNRTIKCAKRKSNLPRRYNKLRPAIEKATADEADGIIKEIQELEEQDRKSIEALKLEVAAAQETINNKQAAVDDDAKELNDLKEQIKARKHEFAKVEEAITTAEAEKQRLEAIPKNVQLNTRTQKKMKRRRKKRSRKSARRPQRIYKETRGRLCRKTKESHGRGKG